MRKIRFLLAALIAAATAFTGSSCSEADTVNYNISRQAEYFECQRRITVYNARTDNIILEMEGCMNISNNENGELVVTVKTGANTYKKNYVYLNEYTLYVVEDITGTLTNPYDYKIYFHTNVLPLEPNVVN
jgi:hypothetical protein